MAKNILIAIVGVMMMMMMMIRGGVIHIMLVLLLSLLLITPAVPVGALLPRVLRYSRRRRFLL